LGILLKLLSFQKYRAVYAAHHIFCGAAEDHLNDTGMAGHPHEEYVMLFFFIITDYLIGGRLL